MKEIKDDKHEDFEIIKGVVKEEVTETLQGIETCNDWLGRIANSYEEIDLKEEFPKLAEALDKAHQGIRSALADLSKALQESKL